MTGPKRPDKRPASSRVRLRARSFGGPASRRSAKSSPGADPTDLGAASNLPTETRATLFSP